MSPSAWPRSRSPGDGSWCSSFPRSRAWSGVANLFITKTVWATLLAVAVGVTLLPYPFLPRHLTIIDSLAIGIPSFFLALAPNTRRYLPGFTGRVLRFAIPAGSIIAAATFAAYALARAHGLPLVQQRTAATLVTLILSLCVLVLLAVPLTWRRVVLVGAVLAGSRCCSRYPRCPLLRTGAAAQRAPSTLAVAALGAAAFAGFGILSAGVAADRPRRPASDGRK